MTARAPPELKFTLLLHHINEQLLMDAFFDLKKTAAVGIDEVTWQDYEVDLQDRITDLHGRIHRGAYRAKPSKRIYIPKPDGRQRPIGIASLEDKLVQKAVVWVLQCIYEVDFLGFSYGYRPGRSQHQALFLHYVFDLWIQRWRSNRARGEVVVLRYADDFVIGFERKTEAEACLEELRARFAKFGLKLHEQKTRLIEFGRYAAKRRQSRGDGRPETFDFLGFTHRCDVTSNGWFALRREMIAKRLRATLAAIKVKLIQRRHWPIEAVGKWLGQVTRGWMNYHAIPGNWTRMRQFLDEVKKLWLHQLRRRSQRHRWDWERFVRMFRCYLPEIKVLHPFPSIRFRARLKAGAV